MKAEQSQPCGACPWRREAARNWLGGTLDAVDWLSIAHSDDTVECHKRQGGCHCIGAAIYRANVCKMARPPNPLAEPDIEKIFASPLELHRHHTGEELPTNWVMRRYDPAFLSKLYTE